MFRCHVRKELSGYLDNQLSDKQKLKLDKHLQECVLCSKELSRLKVLSEKLKNWQPSGLDADFDNSVRNEIVRRELEKGAVKMKKNTLFILVPSSVLAALLMFAFVGRFTLQRGVAGRYKASSDELGEVFDAGKYYSQNEGNVPSGRFKRSEIFSSETKNSLSNERRRIQLASIGESGKKVAYNDENLLKEKDYASQTWAGTESTLPGVPQRQGEGNRPVEMPLDNGSVIVIQPVLPATGEGDKIIRTGTIKLEVENGKETYKNASSICQELGGYMSSSNFYKDNENRESGTITMRIPKEKFTVALDRLSALGKVENIDTNSQDVSQEYANLQSQLDGVLIIYNKMLEALKKRQTTISDAVRLESELTPVLNRVQNLKNKIEYLNNAIALTTITVEFHEAKISIKALNESKRYIKESILAAQINAVRTLSKILPLIIGLAVLIIIVAVIAVAVKNWIVRTFKRG